jgi:hypothetical protein
MSFLLILAILWHVALSIQHPSSHSRHTNKCTSITVAESPEFTILGISGVEVFNYSTASVSGLDFCNITTVLTHHGADDIVYVTTWLPLQAWNGRFVMTGGGGLTAGNAGNLPLPVSQGYAASFTDGGLSLNGTISPGSGLWVLKDPGVLNWELIKNFAHRGNHAATDLSKLIVNAYYGRQAKRAYYSGCSTGGRQGYFAAQIYPDDYDGILANAPNFYTPQASGGLLWPPVVMANIVSPPNCVFESYQAAIVEDCDGIDGANDGLVGEPELCKYDTRRLIGSVIDCGDTNGSVTITAEYAEVVAKSLGGAYTVDGRWIWYGIPAGASFSGLANTATTANGTIPSPFSSTSAWYQLLVLQDPEADVSHLTYEQFDDFTQQSIDLFTEVLGTEHPDLTRFRNVGGKILTWHGQADPLLTHQGTVQYRESLQRLMGEDEELDSFQRIFLAPGVGHCSGGAGPLPVDPLAVLRAWVESDDAPDTLFASITRNETTVSRRLCRWPSKLKYDGVGDVALAESFGCE